MIRRQWLASLVLSAWSATSPSVRAQGRGISSDMQRLSQYMSQAPSVALPPDVMEQAKHHILDTLASMVSGSELEPGQAALRYVGVHAGLGGVPVVEIGRAHV